MATSFSALRNRLYARMGVTVASTAGAALVDEALNAALTKAAAAGLPQLRQSYTGVIPAQLSTTVTAHSASSASITLNSVTAVFPGDILQDAETAADYLIRTVNSATSVVNIGIPITASINGNTVTVIRRSFELPHTGQVIEVRQVDSPNPLTFDPMAAAKCDVSEGTARFYTQGYAENRAVSFINLWPAPAAGDQFVVIQNIAFTEDSSIDADEALISYILAEALAYRRLMALPMGAEGALRMADSLREARSKASGGSGIVTRG